MINAQYTSLIRVSNNPNQRQWWIIGEE